MSVAAAAPVPAVPTNPATDAAKVAQTPPADVGETATVRVRAHQRALKVKAKLEESEGKSDESEKAEAKPEPKAKPKEAPVKAAPEKPEPKPEPKGETKTEAKPAEEDAEAKRRSERHDRIRKAQEREREEARARAQDPRRQRRQEPAAPPDLEARMKRLAELEEREKVWDDEMAILAEAERRGRPAQKLAEAMRSQLTDPSAQARYQARTEAEKIRAEWRQEQEAIRREREQLRQERERIQEEQVAYQKTTSFLGRAKGSGASHPLTQRFHAKHGDVGLINFANQFIAPMLRADYSDEELHDHVEQFLDEVQFAQAQAAAANGTPANGTSHPAKNGAEKPPTTLSNAVASERVSVTEERPLHLMPRRERVARLKAKLSDH